MTKTKMKRFISIITGIGLAVSLALPGGSIFAHHNGVAHTPVQLPGRAAQQPAIFVAELHLPTDVQVAHTVDSCTRSSVSLENALQNTVILNLNQPAECFSIAFGAVAAQPGLSVLSLYDARTVVVVETSPLSFFPELSSKPAASTLPAVPVVPGYAVAVMFAAVGAVYCARRKILYLTSQKFPCATFTQLNMLRC